MSFLISAKLENSLIIDLSKVDCSKKTIVSAMETIELLGDLSSYCMLTRPLAVVIHTSLGASQVLATVSISLFIALKAPVEKAAQCLSMGAQSLANVTDGIEKKSVLYPLACQVSSLSINIHESMEQWLKKESSQWQRSDIEPMMVVASQNLIRGLLLDVIPLPFLGVGLSVYDVATKYRPISDAPFFINTAYEGLNHSDRVKCKD